MTDRHIRVTVSTGEHLDVFLSQSEWNETKIDLDNPDTDHIWIGSMGMVQKDKLVAAFDITEVTERNDQVRQRAKGMSNEQNPRDNNMQPGNRGF